MSDTNTTLTDSEKNSNIFDQMGQGDHFIEDDSVEDAYNELEDEKNGKRKYQNSLGYLHSFIKILVGLVLLVFLLSIGDGIFKSAHQGSLVLKLPFFSKGNVFCHLINDGHEDYTEEDMLDLQSYALNASVDIYNSKRYIPISTSNLDPIFDEKMTANTCLTHRSVQAIYQFRRWQYFQSIQSMLVDYLPDRVEFENFFDSQVVQFIEDRRPVTRMNHTEFLKTLLSVTESVNSQRGKSVLCTDISFDTFYATFSCEVLARDPYDSRNITLELLDAVSENDDLILYSYPEALDLTLLEDEAYNSQTSFSLEVIYSPTYFEANLAES